jgi:hypothetical protein
LLAGLVAPARVACTTGRLVTVGAREGHRRRRRQHASGWLSGRALEALNRSVRPGAVLAVNRSRALAEGTQPSLNVTHLRRASGLSVARARR